MAVDKKFKLGLPRLFRFPFLSCRHRDAADLAQEPVFVSRRSELAELLPRQPSSHSLRPTCPPMLIPALPAICRPRSHPTAEGAVVRCGRRAGRAVRAEACPPAPPASPLPSCIKPMELVKEKVEKKSRKKKKEGSKRKKKHASARNTSSGDSHCFFSSDDEYHDGQLKEADQEADHDLFSSKSFSSDSSLESCRLELAMRRREKPGKVGRSFGRDREPGLLVGEKEQSVAVVKRSSDPYADFRISMVEMIIEKQIFGAQELEKLLDCFLALNAPYHHRVIVEVFEEICEALFSNWS